MRRMYGSLSGKDSAPRTVNSPPGNHCGKGKHGTKGRKLAMKGYAKWASTPAAYKMSAKMARTALKPWTRKETITNGPGPLKGWTDVRDFPAPSKQSFRSWFKERQKGGNA